MRCAYLTMDELGDFVTDADLSIGPMWSLGWAVEMVPWRRDAVDWNSFDAVYICTPWDYFDAPDEFLALLESIEASRATLVNPLAVVRWALTKTYLRDLEARGAPIVPSYWHDDYPEAGAREFFRQARADKLVVKPVVGANAADTFVLLQPVTSRLEIELKRTFEGRRFFVQPFNGNIVDEGEYSLFFFGGRYSHAILKVPTAGDFRVQEEHGADIRPVRPSERLIRTARDILALVDPMPVYARLDFVRGDEGAFLLMELELAEPSLYFRADERSAMRFARAFDAYVRSQRSST